MPWCRGVSRSCECAVSCGGIAGLYQTERNRSDRMVGSSVVSTTAGGKEGLDDTILGNFNNGDAVALDADSEVAASNPTLNSDDGNFL